MPEFVALYILNYVMGMAFVVELRGSLFVSGPLFPKNSHNGGPRILSLHTTSKANDMILVPLALSMLVGTTFLCLAHPFASLPLFMVGILVWMVEFGILICAAIAWKMDAPSRGVEEEEVPNTISRAHDPLNKEGNFSILDQDEDEGILGSGGVRPRHNGKLEEQDSGPANEDGEDSERRVGQSDTGSMIYDLEAHVAHFTSLSMAKSRDSSPKNTKRNCKGMARRLATICGISLGCSALGWLLGVQIVVLGFVARAILDAPSGWAIVARAIPTSVIVMMLAPVIPLGVFIFA